jgi:hypothetical protein
MHEAGEQLMGFEFGRRTTGTIWGRIYDKTVEQRDKGTDFWLDVWGARRDPMRRAVGIGHLGLAHLPLPQFRPQPWPVAPEWRDIQRASVPGGAQGVERMYEGRRKGERRARDLPPPGGPAAMRPGSVPAADRP